MVAERSAPDAKDDDLDDAGPEKQDATDQGHGTQTGPDATQDEGDTGQNHCCRDYPEIPCRFDLFMAF